MKIIKLENKYLRTNQDVYLPVKEITSITGNKNSTQIHIYTDGSIYELNFLHCDTEEYLSWLLANITEEE
jgi:hypothetical protein